MPKAICVQRCVLRGVVEKGETVELTDEDLKLSRVKASFKVIAPEQQAKAAAQKEDEKKPLTAPDGSPLPQTANIPTDELKRKLAAAGVKVPEQASRQDLFVLLQQTLEPVKEIK